MPARRGALPGRLRIELATVARALGRQGDLVLAGAHQLDVQL
jgi:hypothetical protein